MSKNVFRSVPKPTPEGKTRRLNDTAAGNTDDAWRRSLNSMFEGINLRDCTPNTVLETMAHMKRKANRLDDITIAARSRNIAASDEIVLDCLRSLYRDGKIKHREIAGRHLFIYNP